MCFFYTQSTFFILVARWRLYRKEWGLENRKWRCRKKKWKRFKTSVAICYGGFFVTSAIEFMFLAFLNYFAALNSVSKPTTDIYNTRYNRIKIVKDGFFRITRSFQFVPRTEHGAPSLETAT